jgi:hypothetical protein
MNINFIKSSNPIAHKKIRRWLLISSSLSIFLIVSCAAFCAWQLSFLFLLNDEFDAMQLHIKHYDQMLEQQKKIDADQSFYKKQLAKINKHFENPNDPIALLKTMRSYAKNGIHIKHLVYKSAHINELMITAADAKAIINIAKKFPDPSLQISSLEYTSDNNCMAILKSAYRKKSLDLANAALGTSGSGHPAVSGVASAKTEANPSTGSG